MTDLSKYTPLKQIVSYFLDQYQKSMRDFDRSWLMAFRAMAVMGFAASWEPKSTRIPVNGNKTVTLPPDYVSWSKIGILNQNGEVSTLKINNAISIYRDTSPNRIEKLTSDINDTWFNNLPAFPYYVNYFANGYFVPLFGLGSGLIQYGECRVDEKNNVIVLDPNFQFDSVILEYISSPQMDGDYQVETCLQEAVIAFIAWKMKLGTEQEFYARFREGRRALPNKRFTLQELNQAIRESNGFKLKS